MTKKAMAEKTPRSKSEHVMVTFGRGSAELKRDFDQLAEKGGYTKAGLALVMIREGVERRMVADHH